MVAAVENVQKPDLSKISWRYDGQRIVGNVSLTQAGLAGEINTYLLGIGKSSARGMVQSMSGGRSYINALGRVDELLQQHNLGAEHQSLVEAGLVGGEAPSSPQPIAAFNAGFSSQIVVKNMSPEDFAATFGVEVARTTTSQKPPAYFRR